MEATTYRCPSCGMPIGYDPEKGLFYCHYCSSGYHAPDLVRVQEDAQTTELEAYNCPNCGAEIVTEPLTAATFCRFCGAPSLVRHNLQGKFRPDLVIPFSISRDKMLGIFKKWCHHGRFTPKGFYKESQEKILGTYVPFWLFDCGFSLNLQALGTRESSWRSGDYVYTRTEEYDVRRGGDFRFNKVPADGATKMEDGLMDALEPYDYQAMIPFDMPYLAGFAAEKYDQDSASVFQRVDSRATDSARSFLMGTISGYSGVKVANAQKHFSNAHANYAMLPVWSLKYQYKNKSYTFAVNGQTGKVVGRPPVSWFKVGAWIGSLSALFFLLLTLGGALL